MGVRFANRYYMLKTSYDQAYSEQSPGVVLREHVVRHLYETGCGEHDFLGDDEPWKMRGRPRFADTRTTTSTTRRGLGANIYSLLKRLQARRRSLVTLHGPPVYRFARLGYADGFPLATSISR